MSNHSSNSLTVHVYAPIGRDAVAIAQLLDRTGFPAKTSCDLTELIAALQDSAGAAVIAEEGLFERNNDTLFEWIEAQPPWSDLPFIILTSHHAQPAVSAWREDLVARLRSVSLLERPIQGITLTSTVKAALRSRMRQYELRGLMEARERSAQALELLVGKRTQELEQANSELRLQMAERIRAEESLRQAQKIEALGQLTGGVAHDFNNLLMVITAGLDMLDRRSDSEQRSRIMDAMRQAAQRGATLTRQLLTFSRTQLLNPEIVDVAHQIGAMRELLARSLRGDVDVCLEFEDNLWLVEVDPGELELMVLNLAVNARDAMPNGGTVVVRAQNLSKLSAEGLSGDYVRISVADTGTGMTPEVRKHLFEPFFTTKDLGRGSGLGLSQVHGFATQSGGAVSIDSELGRGTTVHVYLPRSTKPIALKNQSASDLREDGRQREALEAASILLVEDDEEVGALVTEMLEQLGFEVTRAASAAAALGALANGRKVDLVFSDIMMPGGTNGVELAREIRSRRSDLPVLLTSGYAEAARRSADEAGLRVLAKPYGLTELASALRAVMSKDSQR